MNDRTALVAPEVRALAGTLPALVAQFDADLRLGFANEAIVRWFGAEPGHFVGRSVAELFGEAVEQVLKPHFVAALGGQSVTYTREMMIAGVPRAIQASVVPRLDAAGTIDGVVLVKSDVSAIKGSEAATAFFESAFVSAASGMAVVDREGRWLRVNRALCDMLGYTEAELLQMHFQQVTHPDDLDDDLANTDRMFAGEVPSFTIDKRYLHKSGRVVHIHLVVAPVQDVGDGGRYTVAQIIDVTARREAEIALREREALFRSINEASSVGIFVDSPAGDCVYANPAYLRMAGLSLEQALGSGWKRALHPDDRALVADQWGRRVADRELLSAEHRFQHADGHVVLVRVQASAMYDGERLLGFVGAVEDITELRRQAEELVRLNTDLERRVAERTAALAASNRDLESFAYSVSHDLRAPLRALDGFSALLQEQAGLDAEGHGHVVRMRTSAQRMARLIDDLLSLAHTRQKSVIRRVLDLSAMANSLAEELRIAHPQRQVEFVAASAASAFGDSDLVHALLQNLLDNAWKFTAARVDARVEFGVCHLGGEAVFFVRDNGVGFEQAYAEKVFLPFQRLHSAADFAGNGIGLASAQRIVDAHGGRIWVESSPGAGALFRFTLGASARVS